MSDEQRTEEEADVEAHRVRHDAHLEPSDEGDSENDFEAHRVRHDRPVYD